MIHSYLKRGFTVNKLITMFFLLVVTLLWQTQAIGGTNAYRMLQVCEGDETRALCHAYINGMLDIYIYVDDVQERKGGKLKVKFCIPEGGVTYNQTRLIFIKHVKANPKALTFPAAPVMLWGLMETFPCK